MDNFAQRLNLSRKNSEIILVEYWLANKEILFTIECYLKDGKWFTTQSEYKTVGTKIEYEDLVKRLNNYVRKEKLEKLLDR